MNHPPTYFRISYSTPPSLLCFFRSTCVFNSQVTYFSTESGQNVLISAGQCRYFSDRKTTRVQDRVRSELFLLPLCSFPRFLPHPGPRPHFKGTQQRTAQVRPPRGAFCDLERCHPGSATRWRSAAAPDGRAVE